MNNVKVPEKPIIRNLENYSCEEIGGKAWQRDTARNEAISQYEIYHRQVLEGIKEDFKKISMISDRKYCISIINDALKKLEG